ncbi:MAG: HAD family acid phosphatase, partial [Woeseiaceae bacterium]
QAYQVATTHLQKFIADSSWSALPGQTDAGDLPTAVILDFDSTVLNHVDFQMTYERPFENWKLDEYDRKTIAKPVPGVVEFLNAARAAGVTLFIVTNRPCEPREGIEDACPQRHTVIDGLEELGVDVEAENVLLSQDRGWNREKSTRRQHVAERYRVLMLIGDDLTDFIACARSSPRAPCTNKATEESRRQATRDHTENWGNGWYILPNPMHGSWTSAR